MMIADSSAGVTLGRRRGRNCIAFGELGPGPSGVQGAGELAGGSEAAAGSLFMARWIVSQRERLNIGRSRPGSGAG
jgi:hypothetical protein